MVLWAAERRYAEAVGAFGPALERLARAYERDSDKRLDLLQEIHVSLWRSLARFDGRCSLRTWVYRVAHNTATSKTIRPQINAPVIVPFEGDSAPIGGTASDEDGFDRRRALERLHELIRQLKPLDRRSCCCISSNSMRCRSENAGLSPANVATGSALKQLLVQRFHEGKVMDTQLTLRSGHWNRAAEHQPINSMRFRPSRASTRRLAAASDSAVVHPPGDLGGLASLDRTVVERPATFGRLPRCCTSLAAFGNTVAVGPAALGGTGSIGFYRAALVRQRVVET